MNKKAWVIPSIIAVIIVVSVVALWSNTDTEYGWAVSKIVKPVPGCVWCGGSCVQSKIGLRCTNNNPVSGFSCSLVNNTCRAVPIVTCTDSDGGRNYAVAGTVLYNGIAYPDSCGNSTSLNEAYCENNIAKKEVYACGTGSVCQNGACIAAPTCTPEGGIVNSAGCCSGLIKIYALTTTAGCDTLIAGNPGYCTKCGDGVCKSPENICSCPADCAQKLSFYVSSSPSSVSLLTGQAQAFIVAVNASGGSGAYRYSYFNADGFGGVNQTVGTQLCTAGTYSCTRNLYWSNAGSYVVRTRVRVTDSSGAYIESIFNSSVVVNAANQTCTPEGGIVNSAGCCSGLIKIYALTTTAGCDTLIAGNPGYCTKCGDGVCKSPENICSCPADCAQTPTKCTGSNSTLLTRFSNSSCTDSSGSFSSYCLNNSVVLFGCNSGLGKCVNVAYDCTPYNTTCSGGYCSMCKSGYRWVNSSNPVKGCVPDATGCKVVPPGCVCMGNNMVVCP